MDVLSKRVMGDDGCEGQMLRKNDKIEKKTRSSDNCMRKKNPHFCAVTSHTIYTAQKN